jgi:hypothetical protein
MLLAFCPLSLNALLALLSTQCFDALSYLFVSIQVALGHIRRLRDRIEIHGVLLS